MLLVSMPPRCRAVCAKKLSLLGLMVGVSATNFAQCAQNGPNSAFCGVLGEFFRGNAAGGAVLGEFFAPTGAVPGLVGDAAHFRLAVVGVLRHAKPSSGVSSACRSLGWRHSPPIGGGELAVCGGVVAKLQTHWV